MPDQSHVGRRYRVEGQRVDAERARAFTEAVAGEASPFEPGLVPPMFAAVYCVFPTLAQLFADSEVGINLAGLVHGEQSFEWPNPVRAGDVVDASAEIASVDNKRGMTFVGIDLEATGSSGEVVCRGRSLMILRGQTG